VKKGQLLMELALPREQCTSCHAEIEENYQFCPMCGCNVATFDKNLLSQIKK